MFNDAKAKINRADKLISELSNEFSTFSKENPGVVRITRQRSGGSTLDVTVPAMPDAMVTILGDAINNMRGAFDHLVFELTGGARSCKFPVANNQAGLASAMKNSKIDNQKVRDYIVDAVKPYFGGDDVLAALHFTDITGKHHRLIPTAGVSEVADFMLGDGNQNTYYIGATTAPGGGGLRVIETDTQLHIVKAGIHKITMYFPPKSHFGAVPIIPTLVALSNRVSSIVADIENLVAQGA